MSTEKRISFSKCNAEHLYEMLRFSWIHEIEELSKIDSFTQKELESMCKFGGCYECEVIGKRLETFIGPDAVEYVNKNIKKYKKDKHNKEKQQAM